jgi:hypothetical protein
MDVHHRRGGEGSPSNGEELVRAMHDKYAGSWYKTVTFTQKTTKEDGSVETWYEAASIPGKLRIDIAPVDSGNMLLFRADSIYQFRSGAVAAAQPFVHPLMVLGFDVYADPADVTIGKLKNLGFDLATMHETTWQGRPVYVVGAAQGDTTVNQFWVDKDRLLFVRMLQKARNGAIVETRFNKYEKLGGGWISPEVLFMRDGKVLTSEEYTDIKGDVQLPEGLFAPEYRKAQWIGQR